MPNYTWDTKVHTSRELKGLRPLLEEWLNVLADACQSDGYEDNPWWYNERASLSTLAGAAWRLKGWQALEEFSVAKRGYPPKSGIGDRQGRRGRCDLYIADHRRHTYGIEAKQAWQTMGEKGRRDHIARAMDLAKTDAGNLHSHMVKFRLGATFTALTLPRSSFSTKVGKRYRIDRNAVLGACQDWLGGANLAAYDVYAYAIAKRCDDFVSTYGSPRIFPGVLLTMDRCKTGTRHKKRKAVPL